MPAISYQNLPIVDEPWNPTGRADSAIIKDILGDDTLETKAGRDKMKRAHLWWDGDGTTQAGYKLKIARMKGGRLTAFWRQLTSRMAIINGARGGVDVPAADKKKAWNHGLRYYDKQGVEKEDQPTFTGSRRTGGLQFTLRMAPVELLRLEGDDADSDEPRWLHVATEGDYPGYYGGEKPFAFTRDDFAQMVANLRAHPSYSAGSDGVGCVDVIPWDFGHASERDPAEGALPIAGAPAQAWTREFEIRVGTDGKAQLWALTRYLETAKGYVKNGQYKWASVAVTFNAIDPLSANDVGCVVTSIAFTNTPFIEGMEQLAANRRVAAEGAGESVSLRYRYYDQASSAEEAMGSLKDLFGLPETTGVEGVIGEIAKLQQWVETGTVPLGVDASEILGGIRMILGLPALSTEAEVLAEVSKLVQRLLEEQAMEQGQPGAAAPAAQPAAAVATAKERDMELLKVLAGKLGVRAGDDAVTEAVEASIALCDGLRKLLKADGSTDKALLEAAEQTVSARDKLATVFKALGVEDVDAAVEQVATLIEQGDALKAALPELEGLKAKQATADEEQADADVAAVMSERKFPEEIKDALLIMRKSNPEKFAEKYPLAPPGSANLTRSVVVTPSGQEVNQAPLGADAVDLTNYRGINPTDKAMNYIRDNVAGAKDWDHDTLWKAACDLKRQPHVIITLAQ